MVATYYAVLSACNPELADLLLSKVAELAPRCRVFEVDLLRRERLSAR